MNSFCKVLIVDDEFIMRQGMKYMLNWEKEGFQIVGEASNGEEGLEMIEMLHPHIVLADIVMPIIDGMEFSRIVQKKYPKIQIIILSGFDKFEYVKSTLLNGAVDYILKPTLNPTDFLKTLKKAAYRITDMVLLKDNEVRYDKLMEKYLIGFDADLDLLIFNSYFTFSCFRLFGTNLKQLFSGNKELIQKAQRMVRDFFAEQEEEFIGLEVMINSEYLLYVINYKVSKEVPLVKGLDTLSKEILMLQEKSHFVLGSCFTKMAEIKKNYQTEFLLLAESFFYDKELSLIKSEELFRTIPSIKKIDYILYSNYLKNKQFGEALDLLKEYIDILIEARTEEHKLKNLVKNFIYNMLVSFEQLNIEVDDIRHQYFLKIDETFYVSDFLKLFDELKEILENLVHQKANSNNRIQEMMMYISEHSSETLDLAEVAKVFNFNYHYLSSYFNLHSQEGFCDYLNKIRVEKACELLNQTMLSIADISGKVGYSDQSYFCRVFKKITGDTPSAYRRRHH